MNMHALPLIIHQTVSTFKQHFFQLQAELLGIGHPSQKRAQQGS